MRELKHTRPFRITNCERGYRVRFANPIRKRVLMVILSGFEAAQTLTWACDISARSVLAGVASQSDV